MSNAFENLKKRLVKALDGLPVELGNEAVNHAQDKFQDGKGEFDGVAWEAPKRKNFTNTAKQKRAATRATLVQKGTLKASIRITRRGRTFVSVGSSLPYASVHNYGGKAGRGAGFQMPQRQFLGVEQSLLRKIRVIIKRRLDRA